MPKLCTFPSSNLELAQMTLGQNHDTPSGCKQSFCEVRMFYVSPSERYGLDMIAQTDGQGNSYPPPPKKSGIKMKVCVFCITKFSFEKNEHKVKVK